MNPPKNSLGEWAALFLSMQEEAAPPAANPATGLYEGVTQAARELLLSVDAGGVPAFVTGHLRQIALENGITPGDDWTPNRIVDALRAKATDRPTPDGGAP